jgi:chromosome segregation protein
MLKALELNGFKSFADKTRFEFPPGITVVVGPNGSGKSNIVDAIKWVLGEQSAKSLRGKDMSDVIFKGSTGANSRRPSNSATATIVLDNSDQRFAYDADEVHVSRRVYRSGESEYLINGETSRLKDIRELFRGTGVGTDAYSLIEQGKVERMLSTNAKDRRAIFEEAAGISRFKAKKVDAQRRLARVEANLVRLADIVDEVGSRYRSVKSQASKAARYKEYSDRLQQLRTFVGLKDYRTFSEKLTNIELEYSTDSQRAKELNGSIESKKAETKAIEDRLDEISNGLTQHQETATQVRENLAQVESHLILNQSRLEDLNARESQLREQLERSNQRAQEFQNRIQAIEAEAQLASTNFQGASEGLAERETEIGELDEKIRLFRTGNEEKRTKITELAELATRVGRAVSAAETQVETLRESKSKTAKLIQELESSLNVHREAWEGFTSERNRLQEEAESNDSALAIARKEYDHLKSELAGRRERMSDLTNQQSGLAQRAEVIEELEKSLEGINAGAKELLQEAKLNPAGPMGDVIGLVADLVSVNVQHAAIVDVALGELAQFVVVDGRNLTNEIAAEKLKLNGRVGLIQLDSPPTFGTDPNVNLNGAPGVIGRADRLVQVEPPYVPFIRQLLGGTWVVKTLADALELHGKYANAEKVRFVTLDGEIVEADGALVVGPKSITSGLVSRRSELRALKRELIRLEEQIGLCRQQVQELVVKEANAQERVQAQIDTNSDLSARLSDQKNQAKAAERQIQQTESQLETANQEFAQHEGKLTAVDEKLTGDRTDLLESESEIKRLQNAIYSDEAESATSAERRTEVEQQLTSAKVKLAKAEQVMSGAQSRVNHIRQEYEELQKVDSQLESQRVGDETATVAAKEEIEQSNAEIALLAARKNELADLLTQFTQDRLSVDTTRREMSTELNADRDLLRSTEEGIHSAKMRIEQIGMQRSQLAERMLDDYGIDLAILQESPSDEELEQRDEVDSEISQLRKKIGSIGSVNLDALKELEELESRYLAMDEQYQDLVKAKETLEKIIVRIDNDSRKLFVETLEAIRLNFQKLFRQTFGGGKADIILEAGVDPLEAGVEIIATPPGKPEFSNSLLSGGEKALTAVSLLMAIFQFRPSPFCVLDEVDAPFDEANIGRFVDVLKSFLGWTKFVIVTHSKKTMTAATTLYGITMQESGVSKRVSVRFEDVSEDGHISDEALQRTEGDAA